MVNEDRIDPLGTYIKFLETLVELQGKSIGQHSYPDAGLEASDYVKQSIREFHQLPPDVKAITPLLYYILGSGTSPYKMTQEDTEYTDEPLNTTETCANCEFAYQKVITGKYICSQIRDEIKPQGWCNQWLKGGK